MRIANLILNSNTVMPSLKYYEASFWEQKYKATCCQNYEWICKPEHIFSSAVSDHINYAQMNKVLQIGCGTSSFCAKLRREVEGRMKNVDVTCIDFSKEVIKKCRNSKISPATYICADVRNMAELSAGSFDYIFDKGCFDCLFCHDNFIKEVLKGLRECYKLLRGEGKLIILSHAKPKNRAYLFRNRLVPFNLQIELLPKSRDRQTQVYAYICTKPQDSSQPEQEGNVDFGDEEPQKKSEEGSQENQQQGQNKEKQEQNNFILDKPKEGKTEDGNFILGGTTGPDKKKDEQGGEDDGPNFILKQAQYQNDFDEV